MRFKKEKKEKKIEKHMNKWKKERGGKKEEFNYFYLSHFYNKLIQKLDKKKKKYFHLLQEYCYKRKKKLN